MSFVWTTPDSPTATRRSRSSNRRSRRSANIRDGAFWKLLPDEQLEFGRRLEMLSRTVYAAQVHHTGEIEHLGIADDRSCSSTQALLRQAFTISAADAAARVKAAAQILPRELMTGGTAAPQLPELAQAVDGGCVGPEHVKIIVETMAKVPANVAPDGRDLCEQTLVDTAMDCDPNFLGNAAQRILDRVDPDGHIDDTTPASKMEFHFGSRSTRTGLTPIKGQLDDHGVEVVKKAIDALSAPRPDGSRDADGDAVQDRAAGGNRRAHGLIEALGRYLDAGLGPIQGGERPPRHDHHELGRPHRTDLRRQFRLRRDDQPRPSPTVPLRRADHPDDPGRQIRSSWTSAGRPAPSRRTSAGLSPPAIRDAPGRGVIGRRTGATGTTSNSGNGISAPPAMTTGVFFARFITRRFTNRNGSSGSAPDGIPEFIPPNWLDSTQRPRRTLRKFDLV